MADTAAEEEGRRVVAALQAELGKVILGKPAVIDDLLAALLGGGHILLEDVPGVGKMDILAAGPDVYQVSAGRSLAYLDTILDVLACLEPCADRPFSTIGPLLFEKLAQTTTVVAVLQDWDEPREAFLRQVQAQGTAVRAIIVHEGATAEPWEAAGADIGEVSVMSPGDVDRALAAGAAEAVHA